MRFLQDYDRKAAVLYAHAWAYGRNPAFYDYEQVGGDCTNFASQCIYAGSGVMNYTPVTGWYYNSSTDRTPSWTGSCLDRGTVPVELSHPQDLLRGTGRGKCRPGGSPARRHRSALFHRRRHLPAFPGSGGHRHCPHIGKHTHCCPQLRCRQPPAVHLSVSGHSFSPYHGYHPSLKEIHNLFTSSPGQMVS